MAGLAVAARIGSAAKISRMKIGLLSEFGPAQIACFRSWRRDGHDVTFVHIADGAPLRFTPSTLARYHPIPWPLSARPEHDTEVAAVLADADILVGVAYLEIARLHALKDHAGLSGKVAGPPAALDPFLQAKAPQIALAERLGMRVLPTWKLLTPEDARMIPANVFPIVLRPDTPRSSSPMFKAKLIRDASVLGAWLKTFQPGFLLLAQPFVSAPNLVVHGARAASGTAPQMAAFIADWKFRGVTQRLVPVPLDPALARRIRAFVDEIGLTGVFHFEFLAPPGAEPIFLEVNGRMGGTTAKVAWCGWDEPALLLASTGATAWPAYVPQKRIVSNRQSLVKRMIGLAGSGDDPLDYPAASRLRIASGLASGFAAWQDEVMDLRDWRTTADFYRMRFT